MRLPDNLPQILRGVGLKVVELQGWQANGRPGSFAPVGTLCHHTGSYDSMTDATNDLEYARWLAFTGRSDLPAPLCQIALSAEGVVYICAAGRANHAGTAKASGTVAGGDGNTLYIGIEAMNSGSQGWGKAQYDAYVLLCAALSLYVTKNSVRTVRAHRETSYSGKWDPGLLDMEDFRADVADRMAALKEGEKPVKKRRGPVIATANIRNNPDMPRARVRQDARKVARHAGIICFQEIGEREDKTDLRTALGKKFRLVTFGGLPIPIAFRKRRYKLLGQGHRTMHGGLRKVSPSRHASWLVLRPKWRPWAKPFVVMNTHFVSSAWNSRAVRSKDWRRIQWRRHYFTMKRVLNEFRQSGLSVFVCGDWNRRKVDKPFPRSRWISNRGIDKILFVPGLRGDKVQDIKVVQRFRRKLHSDHDAKFVRFHLKRGKR